MRNLKTCFVLILALCWGVNARGEGRMPSLGEAQPGTSGVECGFEYTHQGDAALGDLSGAEEDSSWRNVKDVRYSQDGSTLVSFPHDLAIESFTVPEGVTAIGESAFAGSLVKEVNLPASLKHIGMYAFYGCERLEKVLLPEGLECIDAGAFEACSRLTGVQFPHSLKFIGASAFGQCDSLREVHFVEGLEELDYCALWGTPVRSLVLPDSLKYIYDDVVGWDYGKEDECTVYVKAGSYAEAYAREHLPDWKLVYFAGQTSTSEAPVEAGHTYARKDGVLFRDTTLYAYPADKRAAVYRIPEGTTGIDDDAFLDAEPCLQAIYIPSTCTDISSDALRRRGLSGLERYEVADGNPAFRSVDGVLYSKDGQRLLAYPRGASRTAFQVPEGVKAIGKTAFIRCRLESVECPSSLEVIEDRAFAECRQLMEIHLAEGLTRIGAQAFELCGALSQVRCPGTLKAIGAEAFFRCGALKEVYLSEGLEELGNYAFSEAPVHSLVLPESLSFIDETIVGWDYEEGEPTVYVKAGSYAEVYARDYLWNWRIVCLEAQKQERDKGAG